MSTVDDFAALQAIEYGTYRALVPIVFDGALAFNVGDAVPVSNVEQHGYLDKGWVTTGDPTAVIPQTTTPPAGEPAVVDNTQEG